MKRSATALERAQTANLQKIHKDWCARHPGRARQERQLRQEREAVDASFGHKVNGTPETHAKAGRTHQGSLARLYRAGDISIEQLARAAAIAATHERISADVSVRTGSLEPRVDRGLGDGAFFEKLGRVRAEVAYTRWRAALAHPVPVLAMIVDDCGVSVAAKRFQMRNVRAKALLTDALDLYGWMFGQACRNVDDETLFEAHARLLG